MTEEEYIRKTQETLGAIIKKPPLTEKLLAKPPFRFLHDILMAVIKTTGFMDGLYSGAELDSQQVNDKEKKIAFLQKAIDLLQLINGETLSAKPSKIVAGQEPEKTNDFLQALAKAIKKQPSSKEFVQRVLNGEKGGESSSAGSNKENKKSSSSRSGSKEKEKVSSSKEETKEKNSSKEESKDKKQRSSSKDRDSSSAKTSIQDGSGDRNSASKEKEKEKESSRSSSKNKEKKSAADSADEKKKEKKSDDKKSDEKKSSKSKSNEESSVEKNKSNKREDEKVDKVNDDKDKEKKRKTKKKDDNEADNNNLSTLSMNGNDETGVKKEKSKIDMSQKITDDDDVIANDAEEGSPKAVHKGRRGSFSAKEGGGPRTVSAVEGRKDAVQLDDDGGLVKPGLVRQTRSARPATASSTTARPGTAAGRPISVKQDPAGLKRKEINFDDKKLNRGESFIQDQASTTTGKVITESHNGVDDDENFIVDDSGPSGIDNLLNDGVDNEIVGGEIDERDDHGQLVRKILETKKGLENQIKSDGKSSVDKTVIVYDAKEREKAKQESQKLQELVQNLTRNSHPLGKIVDFLQEDVESMSKELQQWRQEYKTNMDNVRQEMGSNSGQLEPLKTKLNELDQQINEQLDAITAIRGRILANEDKVQKVFSSMTKK